MKQTTFSQYAIDNASILFLAQIRKDHTNTFRFTMTLTEEVCPDTLQKAVNRVYRRFPTVIAGFQPGFFGFHQVPAKTPPQVKPDPGCLLTMTREELRSCAYRVYYDGKKIAIEAFHALTDGYGAIASFTTLVAEYLRLKYGTHIPVTAPLLDAAQSPMPQELEDSFLTYENNDPIRMPSRYSYQLPGGNSLRDAVRTSARTVPTKLLLDAAHRYGVSINTLLSTLMAVSVMEIQQNHKSRKLLPVRIMVPVNLRRMFPSSTLRNFSYYALPTMEPEDFEKSFSRLLDSFDAQIHTQIEKTHMASVISNNVKLQRAWFFRIIPLRLKSVLMRLVCRFFGETNSSVTVTNLGNVELPQEMRDFVEHMDVTLTPRIGSPYGCAILSYNGLLSINISRFPKDGELDAVFIRNLDAVLRGEEAL